MSVNGLDHYNIVTEKLDETINFYVNVLGLRDGDRPTFKFPGAWLYCGTQPVVHLIQVDEARGPGSASIDHVAFHATDYEDFTGRLKDKGIAYDERVITDRNLRQVFLTDPNGVKVELNFSR